MASILINHLIDSRETFFIFINYNIKNSNILVVLCRVFKYLSVIVYIFHRNEIPIAYQGISNGIGVLRLSYD